MKPSFKKISFWFVLKWHWFRRLFWNKQKRQVFAELEKSLRCMVGKPFNDETIELVKTIALQKIEQIHLENWGKILDVERMPPQTDDEFRNQLLLKFRSNFNPVTMSIGKIDL